MNEDDFGLDALAGQLPKPTIDDYLRARREAEREPPVVSVLPMPDFVRGGIVRYRCLLDCGWFHDENPGLEVPGPWLLPVDFTSEDLSAAMTSAAEVCGSRAGHRRPLRRGAPRTLIPDAPPGEASHSPCLYVRPI